MEHKFSELELGILSEVGNMSVGGAAGSLSDFMKKTVNISIPKIAIMTKEQVYERFGKDCIIVRINFIEEVQVSNMMILEKEEAKRFAEIILKNQIPDYSAEKYGDLTEEALKEVFNIMVGNMTANMGEILSKKVVIDTPKFITKEEEFNVEHEKCVTTWFDLRIENDMKMKMVDIMEEGQARYMLDLIKEDNEYEKYE